MMLQLRGVVAGYGGGKVLQGVDLEVGAGTVGCIVGPNGAGKSTVLRAISGLLVPSEEEALTVRATRDALSKLDANPERLLN